MRDKYREFNVLFLSCALYLSQKRNHDAGWFELDSGFGNLWERKFAQRLSAALFHASASVSRSRSAMCVSAPSVAMPSGRAMAFDPNSLSSLSLVRLYLIVHGIV